MTRVEPAKASHEKGGRKMDGQRRRDIKRALDGIKEDGNGLLFERLAVRLLKRSYPNINPLPPNDDLGQDAVASPLMPARLVQLLHLVDGYLDKSWSKTAGGAEKQATGLT